MKRTARSIALTCALCLAGCLAGFTTAFLNLKLRILHILAGILTAIALYSVNLRIMDRPNIGLLGVDTIYTAIEHLGIRSLYAPLVVLAIVVLVCMFALDLFLATGVGLALRAAGANPLPGRLRDPSRNPGVRRSRRSRPLRPTPRPSRGRTPTPARHGPRHPLEPPGPRGP